MQYRPKGNIPRSCGVPIQGNDWFDFVLMMTMILLKLMNFCSLAIDRWNTERAGNSLEV